MLTFNVEIFNFLGEHLLSRSSGWEPMGYGLEISLAGHTSKFTSVIAFYNLKIVFVKIYVNERLFIFFSFQNKTHSNLFCCFPGFVFVLFPVCPSCISGCDQSGSSCPFHSVIITCTITLSSLIV